jgi:hypothetical protein
MGLVLQVKTASDVFMEPYASQVQLELKRQLAYSVPTQNPLPDGYESKEVAWSGWARLQELAASVCGEDNVSHLLAVEAWLGVYLPISINPTEVQINNDKTPLQCASLIELARELEQFAETQSLPVGKKELEALSSKFDEDWELTRENPDLEPDPALETYVELMICVHVAADHKMPLWVVK